MSGLALRILGRLPTHLEATRPGKRLAEVTEALASELVVAQTELAAVRRAHRLGHADLLADLRLLGRLHRIEGADLALVLGQRDRFAALADQLDAALEAGDDAERDAVAETTFDLLGIAAAPPRLELFAPSTPGVVPPDLDEAARRLAEALRSISTYGAHADAARRRIGSVARIHAVGNGTVRALLECGASALDLTLDVPRNRVVRAEMAALGSLTLNWAVDDGLFHDRELFWHSSFVQPAARLVRRVEPLTVRANPTIALDDLCAQLAVARADLLATTVLLVAADPQLDQATAARVAGLLGGTGPSGPAPYEVSVVATALSVGAADVVAAIAALDLASPPVQLDFVSERLDALAISFGFVVAPALPVALPDRIDLTRLASRLGVAPEDVTRAAFELGLPSLALGGASGLIPFADAAQLALRLDIPVAPEKAITIEGPVSLATHAASMGLRSAALAADLALLGQPGATATTVLDARTAARLAVRRGFALDERIIPEEEVIGLEENPRRQQESDHVLAHDAELFTVLRRGFSRVAARVHVKGIGPCTVGPMVVNRDEGHGVGYAGAVADGDELVFGEDGTVSIGNTDVTANAYAWKGACFADADDDPLQPRDFVFADALGLADVAAERVAVFAVATPFDALDAGFVFPHAEPALPVPGVALGRSRWAFFVQTAHYSLLHPQPPDPPLVVRVQPRPEVGFLDDSVFAAGPLEALPQAAEVWVEWAEHEAYVVRLLIPRRFRNLDADPDQTLARVAAAVERVRPAGVELRVEYIDDLWRLGESVLAEGRLDPILSLMGGTVLWPPPPPAEIT